MYQIFVVEDELLIRQSIRSIIEKMPGPYAFCGEASDGEMALSLMQDLMPDILLTDIRMPFLDGFDLIRNVKSMMPWLKIVIISGYGDFEFAQKAISLGVDLYLLKPVRAAELTKVIEQIARQIDADKALAALPGGYDQDEVQTALKHHFMQQLLYGGENTSALLERARALALDIVHPYYQPVLLYFEGENTDYSRLRSTVRHSLDGLALGLHCFHDANRMTLLVCGGAEEELRERSYQTVAILRHDVKEICPTVTAVIGGPVQRLSAIPAACRAAEDLLRKVNSMAAGTVVDIDDVAQLTAEIVQSSGPFGEAFQQRLQRAAPEDVPALLDEALAAPTAGQLDSTLMRYHALIDILRITATMICRADPQRDAGEVTRALSGQYDLVSASGRKDAFRTAAEALLRRATAAGRERLLQPQSNQVIRRAARYVEENFCDPNITLISVARHVGMSSAHFSTVFSQVMGKSFISNLTELRIARAKELLATTDMKLATIATEIGYNEPNYFSHVFRKAEGMTPKEYRNACAEAKES